MIVDSMSKYEVMKTLRKEFDDEILPYYRKVLFPVAKKTILSRCQRSNTTVNLGWESKLTSSMTEFRILKRGNKEEFNVLFVCSFHWRGQLCYANFFEDGTVVVYSPHCLQRYGERELNLKTNEISNSKVFYDYILKRQESAFSIVLPTPTHPFSIYIGMAHVLFLGDYDCEHTNESFKWLNTCISFNEARYSQSRIMKSLHEMQEYVESNKIDYSIPNNEKPLKAYLKKNEKNLSKIEELKQYLTQKYLLWKLHISFNFEFTKERMDVINKDLTHIEKYLVLLGVNTGSLSPYSKDRGIAWKGEIDYRD